MMKREWCKRFTDSLVVVATVAVLPTLAFASSTLESTVNEAEIAANKITRRRARRKNKDFT